MSDKHSRFWHIQFVTPRICKAHTHTHTPETLPGDGRVSVQVNSAESPCLQPSQFAQHRFLHTKDLLKFGHDITAPVVRDVQQVPWRNGNLEGVS
mmetsp:Transcript_49811/g.102789  ORF Transcript_49811/g.102789 Transcript_49811/m.102789 type:complete len:95 (-) Transcript_49811:396-680(-)